MSQDIELADQNIVDPEDYIQRAKITMFECRNNKEPNIYVINTSDLEGTTQRGEVSLKLPDDFGNMQRYKIPDTWMPIDLSQFQDKSKWIKDVGLNKLINQGYLAIVKTEIAEHVLKLPDTKLEAERIRKNEMKLRQKGQDITQQMQTALSRDKFLAVAKTQEEAEENIRKDLTNRVNVRITTIMQNRDTDEPQKLAALKSCRSSIGPADISFIISNCNKENPRIKAWALGLRNNTAQ